MIKITPLSEGTFTIDKTKLFVPFNEETDKLNDRSAGSLLVEIQPFVIRFNKEIILLDTGLGFHVNGEMQLHTKLKSAGIQPEDVTMVLLSHLHKDHAGGICSDESHNVLSFPNAMYYVQGREIEYAFEKGFPSYLTPELEMLRGNRQVEILDQDKGYINEFIKYEVTGAHSKFHQVFTIKVEDETIFFGGDDAPQLHQMKHRFMTKYDYDGKKAMELRQIWWEQGRNENRKFLFYHDTSTPISTNSN